jgi:ketosteroid isomerase-like protein
MSTNLQTVRDSYEAFHRRDLPGVLAALAPDVEWVHPDGMRPFGLGGTKKGHDEVIAFIKHVPTYITEMKLHPEEFIESGNRIVVFGSRKVTATTGRSATLKFVHSWTFVNGQAVLFEDYFDTAEMIRLFQV